MTDIFRIADLVFNQPQHITPAAGELIAAVIAKRMHQPVEFSGDRPEPRQDPFIGKPAIDKDHRYQGYRITKQGVAIVNMKGELVNRGAWLGASSGLVSYEGLRQTAKNIGSDSKVRAVILDVDSPGGMATGMIETAEVVRELAKSKPVIASANGMIASAAYGISSAATRIYTTPTSHLGSIGTLMMHLDRSGEMEQRGWKVTFIHAGKHKVDGNQFEPLPESVRDDLQASCNTLQTMFVETVAKGRPISPDQIRETEARIYLGEDAVSVGLADEVGVFDAALEAAASINRKTYSVQIPNKEKTMPQATGPTNSADVEYEQFMEDVATSAADALRQSLERSGITLPEHSASSDQPQVQSVVQEAVETPEQAHARGFADATMRIRSILEHENAKGRQAQARVLALETSMSADEAGRVLSLMPKDAHAANNRTTALYEAVAAQGGDSRVPHEGHTGDRDDSGHQSTLVERMKQRVSRQYGQVSAKEAI